MGYNRRMVTRSGVTESPFERRALVALVLLAFLAPGAWLVVRLPPQPVAQALYLAVAALWLLFAVRGRSVLRRPPRGLAGAVLGVVAVAAVSLLVNRFPLQQLLYDLWGEMPAILWLAYPAVFLVAAGVASRVGIRDGLRAVLIAGAVLIAAMVIWRWTQGFVTTFGSPAYSVPALVPLPFIALGLAASSAKHRTVYRLSAAALAAGLAYGAAGVSAFYALGMGLLALLALAPGLLGLPNGAERAVRIVGVVLLVLACAATLIAEVPTFGSWLIGADDAAGTEQGVATRLYLWDGAERMVTERPLLGYGPAGYRFAAVEFYQPGVFGYIGAIGADPIAFSAPSPHSLLWEVLTRLGLVGLVALGVLLVVWARAVTGAREASEEDRLLRLSLVVGFVAYLAALMVTPVHFASGLLGVVIAGFAAAGSGADAPLRLSKMAAVSVVTLAVAMSGYGVWRMAGLTVGAITGGDFASDAARIESAARIVPGEPLNERRLLELALWRAATPADLAAARQVIDSAPAYITGFTPNLPHFAFIGLTRSEQLGVDDYSWERGLLERAARLTPELPSLVAERLHLAILEGEVAALPELMQRAEQYGATYPMTADYLLRAREVLAP